MVNVLRFRLKRRRDYPVSSLALQRREVVFGVFAEMALDLSGELDRDPGALPERFWAFLGVSREGWISVPSDAFPSAVVHLLHDSCCA